MENRKEWRGEARRRVDVNVGGRGVDKLVEKGASAST
jgi:hypothetical protein